MRPLILAAFFPLAALAQTADFPREVDLFVAGQQVLKIPNLEKVAVGDVEIADVKTIGNNELVVIGAGVGQTSLRIWLTGAPAWIDVKVVVTKTLLVKPTSLVELSVKIGETKSLDCQAMTRVAVGDADIADIKTVGANQLVVKGVTEGSTTLLWWSNSARHEILVHVTK
jgi:Flp pilus assembly secretin CpaC